MSESNVDPRSRIRPFRRGPSFGVRRTLVLEENGDPRRAFFVLGRVVVPPRLASIREAGEAAALWSYTVNAALRTIRTFRRK
jgi:hypothetical protein